MLVRFRKSVFASLLILSVLVTGAWQSNQVVSVENQMADQVEIPLYPGLTWLSAGPSDQNIRTNIQGGFISVSGEKFAAWEQFVSSIPLPQDLVDYYSNAELAKSGWVSYDAFDGPDGVHYVFHHESGVYLSIDYLKCPNNPETTCIAVWKSEPVNPQPATSITTDSPENLDSAAASTFSKISPTNGATGLNGSSVTLKWETYSSAEKYTYCLQETDCANGTNWTSTYSTSVTITNLSANKTYYWQIRALTCGSCNPKTWVYANSGSSWSFKTQTSKVAVVGNAGVAGASLKYVDGTAKTVTSDSTGAYAISVPYNWSGTITPSKTGYLFVPASASFTNLTASQTIQNFAAIVAYTISGNTGVSGVTLSYTDSIPKTVTSDSSGNYSIVVPTGWSGTITPSKTGYSFSPANRLYSNLSANQTTQNYTATYITYTINGNAGIAGATLSYTDGTLKTVTADGSGNYSIVLPMGWSGTVTPSKVGYTFSPANRPYSNLSANQPAQDYKATLITYNISGSTGVGGATLNYFENGTAKTVVADGSGNYTITAPYAWSGTVTPYKNGYTFNPLHRTYTNVLSNLSAQNYTGQTCAGCANINVTIGEMAAGSYTLAKFGSRQEEYEGINLGPLEVSSTNSMSILASQRVLAVGKSFSEMMGYPDSQLTKEYIYSFYNNVDFNSQLRVSNLGSVDTIINVYLGSSPTPIDSFTLGAGAAIRKNYDGKRDGPMRVTSSATNILTTVKAWVNNASYSELTGYPADQLTKEYIYSFYNNVDFDSQLRVSNLGSVDTIINVYLGSSPTPIDSFPLGAGAAIRKNYDGKRDGPMRVTSTSANILTTIRAYVDGLSYSELLGFPADQKTTEYWYPYYDDVSLDSQLRVSNIGAGTTHITVYGGGNQIDSFDLLPGEAIRKRYGITSGPLHVVSSTEPVLTTIRLWYTAGGFPSYYEITGLPKEQLSNKYWFPWYNNVDIQTNVSIAVP